VITLLVIVAFVALVVTSTRLDDESSQRLAGVGAVVVAIHYAAWVAQLGMDATDVAWRQPIEAGLHVLGAHIVAVVALLVIAPLAWRIHGELRLALAGERVTAVVTDRYENLVKEAKRSTFLERVVQARWIDDDGAPHLASGVVSDELWEHVELGSRVDVTVVRDAPHLHVIGREVPGSLILLLVTVCGIAILLVAVWLMAF